MTDHEGADATLVGRIVDLSGHSWVAGSEVVLVGTTSDGDKLRCTTNAAEDGSFAIEVPELRLRDATVITEVPGAAPVPLDLDDGVIEPGEVVIVVNEPGPFHVRYGLA